MNMFQRDESIVLNRVISDESIVLNKAVRTFLCRSFTIAIFQAGGNSSEDEIRFEKASKTQRAIGCKILKCSWPNCQNLCIKIHNTSNG